MLAPPQTHLFKGRGRSTYCRSERNNPLSCSLTSPPPHSSLAGSRKSAPGQGKVFMQMMALPPHWPALGSVSIAALRLVPHQEINMQFTHTHTQSCNHTNKPRSPSCFNSKTVFVSSYHFLRQN